MDWVKGSDPRRGQGQLLPLGELCFPWFRGFFVLNVSSVEETSAETGFGENWCFCEFNGALHPLPV